MDRAREVTVERSRDLDPVETQEWLDSLIGVREVDGPERAHFLLNQAIEGARRKGASVPYSATTPYVNTIPAERQEPHPGDRAVEHRIRSAIRWNALAIVLKANKEFLRARRSYRQLSSRRPSTTPALCISGVPPRTSTAAILSMCRAILRPESTPAPSLRAESPRNSF